jgi:hypothetical protein
MCSSDQAPSGENRNMLAVPDEYADHERGVNASTGGRVASSENNWVIKKGGFSNGKYLLFNPNRTSHIVQRARFLSARFSVLHLR